MISLLLLAVLLAVASCYRPPFSRLHWHEEQGVEYVRVPAIGSRPSAQWLKFVVDANSSEIVVPGSGYRPSATRKTLSDGRFEDTWYFETDVAVLRFRVDKEKSIGSIGIKAGSDIWTQFFFVEFCPSLLELYLHKDRLTPGAVVCSRQSQRAYATLDCPETLFCDVPLSTPTGADFVQTFEIATAREESLALSPLLDTRLANVSLQLTVSGKIRVKDVPYVVAASPRAAIIAESIDDEKNEHTSTALILVGLFATFMYYHIHGVQNLSLTTARTAAAFVFFVTAFVRQHLDVHEKVRYFLLAYDMHSAADVTLIDILLTAYPLAASLWLLYEAHVQPMCGPDLFCLGLRGLCVTLSTIFPAFFVLLVGMDKLNVVVMTVTGGLTNLALIRDVCAPLGKPLNQALVVATWATFAIAALLAIAWIYTVTSYPFVSEVLLFATIPEVVAPFVIASHLFTVGYFTWSSNK